MGATSRMMSVHSSSSLCKLQTMIGGGGTSITRPGSCCGMLSTSRAATFRQRIFQPTMSASFASFAGQPTTHSMLESFIVQQPLQYHLHRPITITSIQQLTQQQQQRQLSSRPSVANKKNNKNTKAGGGSSQRKKKVDPNAPLLNEHLIAELFNKMKGSKQQSMVTADTYEVRLIVDQGHQKKKETKEDDEGDGEEDEDDEDSDDSSKEDDMKSEKPTKSHTPTTQICTLNQAITIAHTHALDLMGVTINQIPPVIKAVDFDKYLYDQKKKLAKLSTKKRTEGGGAISDRPLKEFKFRAGIADHDLERKTTNMMKYLAKGHAIRVTLTARQRSLNMDAAAITTTFERVKELVGDKAVEARGMKANDRKSYGSLLLHPNKSK
eukprot:CAMPEP_0172324584 /NCGR_PEP_ID=MMETSP1058-20130122/51706_1 /TAXON_ID=83371 /ORGANISM="Detonula confervacea, Strain CCMP 353" /LENGTH=380 /DNA_ID=CAMNT_0013040893 /DNA_START=18 /DNA_END=1157 /DNA_ORIENTATION=+